MRHSWYIQNQGIKGMFNYGMRRCLNCGKEQVKESEHLWRRVSSYKWSPPVGRCKLVKN
jgi:hypothetical protein